MLNEILILVLAIPVGYLLAYLTRDELVEGRKWFKLVMLLSAISAVVFLIFNITISLTLGFMFIVSWISLKKSYNAKFVK